MDNLFFFSLVELILVVNILRNTWQNLDLNLDRKLKNKFTIFFIV